MGSDQSKPSGAQQERPVDYYELLQVDEEATAEDIKKQYRRLALANHPDKNPHRIEEATKLFTELQQAYEILSDPNERAFYDQHRNRITVTDEELYEHVQTGGSAVDPNKRKHGDPGVRLEQLMRFFDPKLARTMDDSTQGFYSIYRSLFALLASDESLHGSKHVYPSFGDPHTAYAPLPDTPRSDRNGPYVKDFYTVWLGFATAKRFEWVGKWDVERGDDRGIRRLMEKENKKTREDYRKEYNETVRQLALFIQHRDPRQKAYRSLRKATKKASASAKSQTGNSTSSNSIPPLAEFEEQDWQKLRHSSDSEPETDPEGQTFECVACGKDFASEASWANHEKSKKHKQAVYHLRKELELEEDDMAQAERQDDHAENGQERAECTMDEPVDADADEQLALEQSMADLAVDSHAKNPTESSPTNGHLTRPVSPSPAPISVPNRSDLEDEVKSTRQETPTSLSKRDKRRAKEAKKKADADNAQASVKEARKAKPSAGSTNSKAGRQDDDFVAPKRKGKVKQPLPEEVVTDEKIEAAIKSIEEKQAKLSEKWADHWDVLTALVQTRLGPAPRILCLGIGRPYADRTAQIQIALLIELCRRLGSPKPQAFDPVWGPGDTRVMQHFADLEVDNQRGAYTLTSPTLVYMPHCPRPLYESLISANYDPTRKYMILGNDLADYLPDFSRGSVAKDEFELPKKKRSKNVYRPPDSVLRRVVPSMACWELSRLPETNLPGFARAFLSLAFQYIDKDLDYGVPLPTVEFPNDDEIS